MNSDPKKSLKSMPLNFHATLQMLGFFVQKGTRRWKGRGPFQKELGGYCKKKKKKKTDVEISIYDFIPCKIERRFHP